jgi:predicted phage terminase large subunit-like protein
MHPKRPDRLNVYFTTDWALGEKNYNDFSVILPFGVDEHDNIWILPDVVRIRATPEVVVERLIELAQKHKPLQIGIEASHITKTIGPFLKRRMQEAKLYIPLWDGVPSKDKVARCASIRGRMQQGKVYLPDTPFFREIVFPEIMQFPAGRHDDVVDCFAWAGIMLEQLITAAPLPNAPKPGPPQWSKEWMDRAIKIGDRSENADRKYRIPHLNGRSRTRRDPPGL